MLYIQENFKVSDCTFKKVKRIDLYIIQNLEEYNTFILAKMHISKSLESQFVYF